MKELRLVDSIVKWIREQKKHIEIQMEAELDVFVEENISSEVVGFLDRNPVTDLNITNFIERLEATDRLYRQIRALTINNDDCIALNKLSHL